MTREEAAKFLHPDTRTDAIMMGGIKNNGYFPHGDLEDAERMGAEALMPWVETARRPPTEADANEAGNILVACRAHSGKMFYKVSHWSMEDGTDYAVWWMAIPPLSGEWL